jgi:hypothetical protein
VLPAPTCFVKTRAGPLPYEDGPYLPNCARAARKGALEISISPV